MLRVGPGHAEDRAAADGHVIEVAGMLLAVQRAAVVQQLVAGVGERNLPYVLAGLAPENGPGRQPKLSDVVCAHPRIVAACLSHPPGQRDSITVTHVAEDARRVTGSGPP